MHWPALVCSLQDPLRFKPVGGDAFEGTGKTDKAKAALTLLQKHDEKELKKARPARLSGGSVLRALDWTGRDWTVAALSHSPVEELLRFCCHFGTSAQSFVRW